VDGVTMPGWTTDITYSADADCIAIYWKGLPGGSSDLRIDITRKFNGFPLP